VKVRIDKALIRSLKPDPAKKEILIWDTALRRFGLRLSRNGRLTYLILYTPAGQRRQRMLAVGDGAVLTLDQARDQARRLLMRVDAGEDPAQEKVEAREVLTFGAICQQYLDAAGRGLVVTNKRRATPFSSSWRTIAARSAIERANRSIRVTRIVSPGRAKEISVASSSRPARLVPDLFSLRMFEQPAAARAASWMAVS
jgi:hypothetical protein